MNKISNEQIKEKIDTGDIVISNIQKDGDSDHYVLVYGYNGNKMLVNDPMKNITSYSLN